MAEGTGLENRHTGNGIESSNLSLSVHTPRVRPPGCSGRNCFQTMESDRRRRAALLVVLLLVSVWGAQSVWARSQRAARTVAWVTCPWRGDPEVVIRNELMAVWDTLPARMHEEVHAQQCRQLGPMKYRLRNFTPSGKLELEAPAYCASAVARLTFDPDSQYASDRVHTDMIEGMSDVADSNAVKDALMRYCPAIAFQPRRTRGIVKRAMRDSSAARP